MAQHNDLGHLGEAVAARHLILNGYSILARDWHCGHRDLDIVAAKDGTVVFVEVKTRTSTAFGSPEEAIDNHKVRSILAAAGAYVRKNRISSPVRFDVITVVGDKEPFEIRHIRDAISPNSLKYYGRDHDSFTRYW